jgi:hypothetical protein
MMGHYAGEMDGSPGPNHRTVDKAKAWDAVTEKNTEIAWLKAELERRTSERDYHMRMADQLANRIRALDAEER